MTLHKSEGHTTNIIWIPMNTHLYSRNKLMIQITGMALKRGSWREKKSAKSSEEENAGEDSWADVNRQNTKADFS